MAYGGRIPLQRTTDRTANPEQLRKTHPNTRLLVGAYNVYSGPPVDRSVKVDPMIDVILTHYDSFCMAHPVQDPQCPPNQRYAQLLSHGYSQRDAFHFVEFHEGKVQ